MCRTATFGTALRVKTTRFSRGKMKKIIQIYRQPEATKLLLDAREKILMLTTMEKRTNWRLSTRC